MEPIAWSVTKARTYQECARRYAYRYLIAPRARRPGASTLARETDLLKGLVGLEAWAGSVVHAVIEEACRQWRLGRTFGEAEAEVHALRLLRTQYRSSRDYWAVPPDEDSRRPLLLDLHRYGEGDLGTEHGGKIRRKVVQALEQFLGSEIAWRIQDAGPRRWLPIDRNASFHLDAGLLVLVKPDFAYRQGGYLELLDWKTGRPDARWEVVQLACYALYAREKWRAALEEILPRVVQLYPEFHISPTLTTRETVAEAAEIIRDSAAALPRPDFDGEEPAPGSFEPAGDTRQCRWCAFRGVCETGLQAGGGGAPSPGG